MQLRCGFIKSDGGPQRIAHVPAAIRTTRAVAVICGAKVKSAAPKVCFRAARKLRRIGLSADWRRHLELGVVCGTGCGALRCSCPPGTTPGWRLVAQDLSKLVPAFLFLGNDYRVMRLQVDILGSVLAFDDILVIERQSRLAAVWMSTQRCKWISAWRSCRSLRPARLHPERWSD